MKKIKIYLETSAISNLYQLNKPKEMADMKALWELLKQGEYDVVISQTVIKELNDTKDDTKREMLFDYLDQIDLDTAEISEEMLKIAQLVILQGILTENSYNDCEHVAYALITNCDCIVSYNFRHLVKIRTITGVQRLANIHGYGNINIVSADYLL